MTVGLKIHRFVSNLVLVAFLFLVLLTISFSVGISSINVKDYKGSVKNLNKPLEDWIPAIQKAIGEAVRQGGGVVFFPPGQYLIRPNTKGHFIAVSDNITLRGSGHSSIIKIGNNIGDYSRIIGANGPIKNVRIEDLRFDQSPDSNTTCKIFAWNAEVAQFVVYFPDAFNVVVNEVEFDPCSGVNTVWLGGRNAVVSNCYFRFARGRSEKGADYDNSAVYFECRDHKAFGNTFYSEYSQRAYACIETHNGSSTIFGNTSQGYRTGVNIVTEYTGTSKGSPHRDRVSNDINVYGNTFSGACQAIMLWPGTGKTLSNVNISSNTISLHQNEHKVYAPITYFGISSVLSYETFAGTRLPAVYGDIDGLVISNNTIVFQDDSVGDHRADYAGSGGILLRHEGNSSNVIISNNLIKNSPSKGIGLGGVKRRTGKKEFSNILVEGNQVVNAGQSLKASGYRAVLFIGGDYFRNLRIVHNMFVSGSIRQPHPALYHVYDETYLFGLISKQSFNDCTIKDNYSVGLFNIDTHSKNLQGIEGISRSR